MSPILSSRRMYLRQLPSVINIAPELDEAIREFTTKGLQQTPSVEANAVICFDGTKFYLENKALGSSNASTTNHAGVNGVGMYHSHPHGGPLHAGDYREMLNRDRRTENFTMLDGAGDRRSALFKTIDSPTIWTREIQKAQRAYKDRHPPTYNRTRDLVDEVVEIARCAFMGYYEGRGRILYRVYPT